MALQIQYDRRMPVYRLTIDLPPLVSTSAHRTREAAFAALRQHFSATDHDRHLAEASWTHSRYDLTINATVIGHAVIDELCACEHTHREHDEVGCTVTEVGPAGLADCACRSYEPVRDDPALFAIGMPSAKPEAS
jgi:hypothetical protein